MKQFLRFLPLLLVAAILVVTPASAAAQAPAKDPEGVIRAIIGALEAGDAKTALSYTTNDTVLVVLPAAFQAPDPLAMTGTEAVTKRFTMLAADKGATYELSDFHVEGPKVTWTAALAGGFFSSIGLTEPLEADCVGIVEDGKLASWTWMFTPASVARFQTAMTLSSNKEAVRNYLAAWEQGDQEAMGKYLAEGFVNHSGPLPKDREGLIAALIEEQKSFPDGKVTIRNIMAEGDWVFVYGNRVGTHTGTPFLGIPPTGAKVSFDFSLLLHLKDGKIVERWATADDVMGLLVPLGYKVVPPTPTP